MAALGKMQLSSSQQQGLVFGGAFLVAGIVLSTMVFPFWHLIREDVFEDVVILNNEMVLVLWKLLILFLKQLKTVYLNLETL